MLEHDPYLTDADRARLRAEAIRYASARYVTGESGDRFATYHVNRNEMFRVDVTITFEQWGAR